MPRSTTPKPLPRVLKTKAFARDARREGISDAELCEKANGIARGVGDDLGGGLWKVRVGVGRGISRAIVLTKCGDFYVYQTLYAKDVSSDLSALGKRALRKVADDYLATLNPASVAGLKKDNGWEEICDADDD